MGKKFNPQTTKLLFLTLFVFFVACNDDDNTETEDCFEHFNYDLTSDYGPSNWDNYCVDVGVVNQCASIVSQSPIDIDITETVDVNLETLNTDYDYSTIDILNNGHTIQFNYNGLATLNFDDTEFSLIQFHFHANSEHTVDGTQYPLEVHLVHSGPGALVVIGIFFEAGDENTFLAKFMDNLPDDEDETYTDTDNFYFPSELFPADGSYFNYNGSLTTPPCSEVVEWIVMETPVEASLEQLNAFTLILQDNYRPIQPLSGRTIGRFIDL